MAIVPNLSTGQVDKPYTTPNRVNAGPPGTSQYAGEIVYDSTAKICIVNVGSPAVPMWAPWNYGWMST
jgi:hypothetical protein